MFISQALVLVVLIIIIFFYSKVRWYSIVIVLMSTLLSYLTNFITVAISLYTENIIHIYFYNIFSFFNFIILSLILAHLFKHLLIRLRYSYLYLSKGITLLLFLCISYCFYILLYNFTN